MDLDFKVPAATRIVSRDSNRLDALAKKEKRTRAAMLRILITEALNQRECSAAIRRADDQEQETAQEVLDRLNRRTERKRQEMQ